LYSDVFVGRIHICITSLQKNPIRDLHKRPTKMTNPKRRVCVGQICQRDVYVLCICCIGLRLTYMSDVSQHIRNIPAKRNVYVKRIRRTNTFTTCVRRTYVLYTLTSDVHVKPI